MRFIDFCAGIGAGRLGLERLGLTCIGFAEIELKAERVYRTFYGDDEPNYGDVMTINPQQLPDFDLMIAGFPCQSFSICGVRRGLEDERGQIVYGLTKILEAKQPRYFILENVKGLVNHDRGQTFAIITRLLSVAGYALSYKILDSRYYGLPHMRERIYIVGVRRDVAGTVYQFPQSTMQLSGTALSRFLSPDDSRILSVDNPTFQRYLHNKYNAPQGVSIEHILSQDYNVVDTRQSDIRVYQGVVPTIRKGRQGILYTYHGRLYKLSGAEALRLQGFPMDMVRRVVTTSESVLHALAGNAMSVNVIEAICRQLIKLKDENYGSPRIRFQDSERWISQ